MAAMMTANIFDDLPNVFEELVDWPKRLANEAPFYRRLFEHVGVGSVVDVACGTGRHAAMFHSWNLQVEGADVSPQMIELVRHNFGEPPGLRWVVRSFDAAIEPAASFDAAICVGNSLALAPDLSVVKRAIQQMLSAVRSGGVVVVHVLNLWHLPEGPCVWHKDKRITLPQGEAFIARGVHRCGRQGYVEWIVADLSGAVPMRGETAQLLGLDAAELERMARHAGAAKVSLFGGYQGQPYDRQQSVDLLLVAEKGKGAVGVSP
jgi:SAM-dependent methyltransferase